MQYKVAHYLLQREIGSTSYSKVYITQDQKNKRIVVVKKIPKENPNAVDTDRLYKKEIMIYTKIKEKIQQEDTTNEDKEIYKNLFPEFIQYINSIDNHYLVLEYCECNLANYLKYQLDAAKADGGDKDIHFDQKHAQDIISEITLGMSMLHQHDFCHRDLKPQNILIKQNKRERFKQYGNVKIADFSFASEFGQQMLMSQVGTEGYRAREIQDHEAYCPQKSDMFSLGVIWHELLTGSNNQKNDFKIDFKIVDNLKMTIDEETKKLIQGMTNVDPKLRPSWPKLLEYFAIQYQQDESKSERFRRSAMMYKKQKYDVYQDLHILADGIRNQLKNDPNLDYYIYLIIKWIRYIGKDLSKIETHSRSSLIGLELKYDKLYIEKFEQLISIHQQQDWPELNFFKTENFDQNLKILRTLLHNNQIGEQIKEAIKDIVGEGSHMIFKQRSQVQ